MVTERELRLLGVIQALRAGHGGNPNHDPANGQFSSGGGSGSSKGRKSAKKKGKKKGKKRGKRVKLTPQQKAQAAGLRERLHARAARLKSKQWNEQKALRGKHDAEAAAVNKKHDLAARAILGSVLADKRAGFKSKAEHATWQASKHAEVAAHREAKAATIREARGRHSAEWKALDTQHAAERHDFRTHVADQASALKQGWASERVASQAAKAAPRPAAKPAAKPASTDYAMDDDDPTPFRRSLDQERGADVDRAGAAGTGEAGPGAGEAVSPAPGGPAVARGHTIGPGRLHKAGNAESILRHCLRTLGLTRRYREGRLTRGQQRRLLMAIREYGRAWLRHEAEQFMASVAPVARGIRWDAEGEFLHATETGFAPAARRFFGRAKAFVRETIVAGVMSLLGPAPLTGEELDAAEKEAQRQDQYFDKFEYDLAGPEPTMSPKQFAARVEKYADSGWQSAQRINRTAAIGQGTHKMERRVLGDPKTSHCEDCPPLAEQGWQPLGTLPQIGDTECGPLCLCHFEYSDGGSFATMKGRVPLGGDVSTEDDDGGVYPVAEPPGVKLGVPIAGPPGHKP